MSSSMSIGDAIRKCCIPKWNGKPSYQQSHNIKNGISFKQECFNNKLGSKDQMSGHEKLKGSSNIFVYEQNELETRLTEAIGEVNAKKITIISLRDRLCSAEASLIKSKNRESYYKTQLENGSREFKRLRLEKEQAQGLADHHREQQLQAEEEFQLLLKTQRQHIQMLHEHLTNEELMVKQREYDRHEIVEIKHKIKNLQKELEIERAMKNEAKKELDDIQAELDDLLTETNGLRIKLNQSKQENERLTEVHKDEIAEYKSMNEKEFREELEMRVVEAQYIAHHKFDQERFAMVKEIENYHKKCKELEAEKQKYAGEVQHQQAELESIRAAGESIRAAGGSIKQQYIDKLKRETESLNTSLEIMTAKLDSLETEKRELVASVSLKDGELRRAQQWKGRAKKLKLFEDKCKDILDKDENIQELANRAEQVQDNSSFELGNDATVALQEEAVIELHTEAADMLQGNGNRNVFSATASAENIRLNERLRAIENEIFIRDSKIADLERRNSILSEKLKIKDDGSLGELKALQEELSFERETVRRNSQEWTELVCKFDADRNTWQEKIDKLKEENQALQISCEKYAETIEQNKVEIESLRKTVSCMKGFQEKKSELSHELYDSTTLLDELQKSIKCEVANLTSEGSNLQPDLKQRDALVEDMQGQSCTTVKLQENEDRLEKIVDKTRKSQEEPDTKREDGKLASELLNLDKRLQDLKGYNEELEAKNKEQHHEIKELKNRLRWQDSGTHVEDLEKELQMVNKKMTKMMNKEEELRIINEQQKIVIQELKEKLLEVEQDLKMKEELFKNDVHNLTRQKDWMKTRKEKLSAENSELQNQLNEQQRKTNESKLEAQEVFSKIKAAQFELAASESSKKTLEKRCQKLKKQLADKEIECNNFETNYNELLKEFANEEKKHRQLNRDSDIEANVDKIESAKRQFDRKVIEHEARLTEREAQLDKTEAKLEECEIALAKSEEKRHESEKDLKYLRKLFNKWTIDFDEMKAENSGLKKELKTCKKYSGIGKYDEKKFGKLLENENSDVQVAVERVEDNNEQRIVYESNEKRKKMDEENELHNEMRKQIRLLNSELDSLKEDFEKAEIMIHLDGCKEDFQRAVIDIRLNSLKKDFEKQEMEIHIKIKTQGDEKKVVQIRSNNFEGLKAKAEQGAFEIRPKNALGKLDDNKEAKDVRVSTVTIDSTMKEQEGKNFENKKKNYGCNQQGELVETYRSEFKGRDKRNVQQGLDKNVDPEAWRSTFMTECAEPITSEVNQAGDEYSKDVKKKSNVYKIVERDIAESRSGTWQVTVTEAGAKVHQRFKLGTINSRSDSDEDFWGMELNESPRNINLRDANECNKDFEVPRPAENPNCIQENMAENNVPKESEWTNIAEVCVGKGSEQTTIAENCVGEESGAVMTGKDYGRGDLGEAMSGKYYNAKDFGRNTSAENYVVNEPRQTVQEIQGGDQSKQGTKSILHTAGFKISRRSEKKKVGFKDNVDVHYFDDDDFYGTWNRTPLLSGFEGKWNIHIDVNGVEEDDVTGDKTKENVEAHCNLSSDAVKSTVEEGDKNERKESSRVKTQNTWLDGEEDMLSNFILNQKKAQKSASSPSKPNRVDDVVVAVDIEDVVASIEKPGDELNKNGTKVENDVDRKYGDSESYVLCKAEGNSNADSGALGEEKLDKMGRKVENDVDRNDGDSKSHVSCNAEENVKADSGAQGENKVIEKGAQVRNDVDRNDGGSEYHVSCNAEEDVKADSGVQGEEKVNKTGAKVKNDVDRSDGGSECHFAGSAEENLNADFEADREDNVTEDITVSEINMADFDYYETVEPLDDGSTGTHEENTGKQDDSRDSKQTTLTAEPIERSDITVEEPVMEPVNGDSLTDPPEPVSSSLSLSSLLRPAFGVARNSLLPPLAPRKGAMPPLDCKKMNM